MTITKYKLDVKPNHMIWPNIITSMRQTDWLYLVLNSITAIYGENSCSLKSPEGIQLDQDLTSIQVHYDKSKVWKLIDGNLFCSCWKILHQTVFPHLTAAAVFFLKYAKINQTFIAYLKFWNSFSPEKWLHFSRILHVPLLFVTDYLLEKPAP